MGLVEELQHKFFAKWAQLKNFFNISFCKMGSLEELLQHKFLQK